MPMMRLSHQIGPLHPADLICANAPTNNFVISFLDIPHLALA